MRLVWLASYPKCGNTWARFLLYQYFHGEAASSAQVASFIPDIHTLGEYQAAARMWPERLIVKTHNMWTPGTPGQCYVLIVRHPRDALASIMNFHRLMSPRTPFGALSEEEYVRAYIRVGRNPLTLEVAHGTIEEHWRSWLGQDRVPGIVVRYEDIRTDGVRELRRMVECMGETFDEARGRRAVELSTFDRMRALEVREKTAGLPGTVFVGNPRKVREGVLFMNRGQSGRSLEKI